ncbi:MAG: hypothetical protein K6F86_03495 [Lachnospiraceae bacterium]|nr:hypothetical protein [Lachnospiraceae bacterium]
MFTAKELNMVSRKYFRVLDQEDDIISLESKNTRHGWYIYRPYNKYQNVTNCIIYHRHENQTEYHKHGYTKTFDEAINQNKQHDNYQINVRWGGWFYKGGKKK